MTQPEVRGQSSPSPFLQSLNSSLWTARLAPCGPMIVLITSTTQPAQTHVTHAAAPPPHAPPPSPVTMTTEKREQGPSQCVSVTGGGSTRALRDDKL